MLKRRISLLLKGLYLTLALAVGPLAVPVADAQTKPKAKATKSKTAKPKASKPGTTPERTTEHDPLTEWELVNGAAIELRQKILRQPRDAAMRQQMADLAVRSAAGAERALAIGDASLFDSYRTQFRGLLQDTRWRLDLMSRQGGIL